jgi:hypothetical protein
MKKILALLALAGAVAVQAQQPPEAATRDNKDKDKEVPRIPYSGGGIRGIADIVADGTLILPAEARELRGEDGYNLPLPLRPRAVLPSIEVLRPGPQAVAKVTSPLVFEVRFRGMDAPIDPASFKVLYGAERIDITKRFTSNTKIEPGGFTIAGAKLPPGKHQLVLQVQDARQRTAERDIRLEVE